MKSALTVRPPHMRCRRSAAGAPAGGSSEVKLAGLHRRCCVLRWGGAGAIAVGGESRYSGPRTQLAAWPDPTRDDPTGRHADTED